MKILSKEFILGSGIYIGLYLIIAAILRYSLLPQGLKPLEYGLGHDFFLVLAPIMGIATVMLMGTFLYLLHQLLVVVGMLFMDTLSHFKKEIGMYQYTVYYDYEKNGVWTYNEKFTTTFQDKKRHASAEWECDEWINANLECDAYRIIKSYCD